MRLVPTKLFFTFAHHPFGPITFACMKLLCASSILLFLIALASCRKYDPLEIDVPGVSPMVTIPDSLDLGAPRTVQVLGVVRDEQGNAVSGAVVQSGWGSQQTTTDAQGFFKFEDLTCYDRSAYVKISKLGFFHGSRSWIPTTGGYNRVEVQLLTKNIAGSFASSDGGTIQIENFTLVFPPNAISLDGTSYSGQVSLAINAIDPTDLIELSEQMPGCLTGIHLGEFMVMRSLGMAAIELIGEGGQLLQLTEGSVAEIRYAIPAELQSLAPSTIPLWSFNEATGFWKFEGTADRLGNEYVGQATHFSYWNFDLESEGVNYTVTVNYNEFPIGFYPLDNAVLTLSGPNVEAIPGTTGTNGQVTGLVPANETMQLQIMLPCAGGFQEVYSTTVGPFTTDVEQTIEINSLPYLVTINGELQDCDGNPSSGYVWLNDDGVAYVANGSFQFTACTGINSLHAYCFSNGQAGTGLITELNLSAGTAEVEVECEDCFPIGAPGAGITDVDGNFYPTVINGDQEWMAANLATTHYSNGDAIAEVSDNTQWASTTTPAWCYLNNNVGNNVVFGKFYNGYAMEDSRNVCPIGWHVPGNDEWETLITTLGGASVAGSAMRTTGNIAAGTGLWPYDNVVSTNISGFSAQPSGFRNLDGTFASQIYCAVWWTRTLTANDTYYTRSVYSFSNSTFNQDFTRPQGFSVRCLRD